MRFRKRLLHLIFSFKSSWLSLAVGLVLSVFSILYIFTNKNENSQILGFLVGIIASIVATIILRVSDNYLQSCIAHDQIQYCIGELLLYIDKNIADNSYDSKECKFKLWQLYLLLCEKSIYLTYDRDFSLISDVVEHIIELVDRNSDIKEIMKAKQRLNNILNNI